MRIEHLKRQWASLVVAAVAFVVASLALPATVVAQERGGTLVIAGAAQPPTLDMMFTLSQSSRDVAMNIFEMLYTLNDAKQPIPELADDVSISDDGLVYTFKLRKGIKFHNGKEMTSTDVLASFERFARVSQQNQTLSDVAGMRAPDAETFEVTLNKASPIFLSLMASYFQPIIIIPSEEATKEGGQIEVIGTGPYQLDEWIPDSHIRLKRFEGYVPDERYEANEGFGGKKVPYLDVVEFKYITEASARFAALKTGQIQIDWEMSADFIPQVSSDPSLVDQKLTWWQQGVFMNLANPPMDDIRVRRAIQVALDMDEIMQVATDNSYEMQPGLQYPGDAFYTDAGKELYNVKDLEWAKSLLAEAGYDGTPLKIVTSQGYPTMYKSAIVMAEQLKQIGVATEMEVYDWPTAVARRGEEAGWHMFPNGSGTGPSIGPYTSMMNVLGPKPMTFIVDDALEQKYQDMITGPTEAARKYGFARFQQAVHEQAAWIKFGDYIRIIGTRAEVKGFEPHRIPRVWNVWLQR